MKQLSEKSVDLIIEDKPYGKLPLNKVNWDSSYKIEGIFEQYNRILKNNGQLVIWGQQPMLSFVLIEALENDFVYRFEEIWEKPGAMWNSNYIPMKIHEQFIVFKKKKSNVSNCVFNINDLKTQGNEYVRNRNNDKTKSKNHNIDYQNIITENNGYRFPTSILKAPSKPYMKKELRTEHPTQKSNEISDWIVKGLSNKGNLIYIPFAGSGTEIESCIRYNRSWIATEINDKYINDIIIPRINNMK